MKTELRPGPLDSQAAHDRWWVVKDFSIEHERQTAVDLALAGDDETKREQALVDAHARLVAFAHRERS